MSIRIQVVVDEREREVFNAQARREGRSLSDWMRVAARERLAAAGSKSIKTPEDLKRFFAECDAREVLPEPDWDQHLEVIAASRIEGLARP